MVLESRFGLEHLQIPPILEVQAEDLVECTTLPMNTSSTKAMTVSLPLFFHDRTEDLEMILSLTVSYLFRRHCTYPMLLRTEPDVVQ